MLDLCFFQHVLLVWPVLFSRTSLQNFPLESNGSTGGALDTPPSRKKCVNKILEPTMIEALSWPEQVRSIITLVAQLTSINDPLLLYLFEKFTEENSVGQPC